MRKLLLATAVAMGASLAGFGAAQAQVTTIPTLLPGTSPFGGPTVAPGTVVVRLGWRVEFFAFDGAESGDKAQIPSTATNGFANQSYKQGNYAFGEYMRLYPSVDGVAANGLQYGAFVELRHENYTGSGNGAGSGGVNGGCGGSSSSAQDRCTTIYVRREYVYLGAPAFGTLRLGSTDGPSSLFETGTFENFNDGAWNGDVPNMFGIAGSALSVPFATVGIMYDTGKAVYLSPTFAGFSFGAAFEPTPYAVNDYGGGNPANVATTTTTVAGTTVINGVTYNTSTNCAYASPGCARLSSASNTGNRRRNLIDVAGHYAGTFGPVGIAAQLGWIGSQHDGVEALTSGAPGAEERFHGLNVGDFGLTATFAGVSVGGHITGGEYNGQWGLNPVGAKPAVWALGGVSYSVGPLIVGASYFQLDDSGNSGAPPIATSIGQQRTRGLAVGGTYTLAPGVALFASYLNGNIKENGFNLLGDGEANTTHNQVNMNGFGIGTFIRW